MAVIPCSFYFDLGKKNLPAHTYSKNVMEDNQTIIFIGLLVRNESPLLLVQRCQFSGNFTMYKRIKENVLFQEIFQAFQEI